MTQEAATLDVITEDGFLAWVQLARPGEQLIYHHGYLAVDADFGYSHLQREDARALRKVADAAMRASRQSLVHLVQRRFGDNAYSYIAVASSMRGPGSMRQ